MAQTSFGHFGPWKFVLDMGSSSHWGVIVAPDQESNMVDLGMSFRSAIRFWYESRLDEVSHGKRGIGVQVAEIFL